MTEDPQKGKAAEEETEAAAEATEETKPKPKRKPAAKKPAKAEGTAAEATGVDKDAAEAAAVTEPTEEPAAKPKRSRAKKEDAPATKASKEEKKPARRSRGAKAEEKAAPATRRSRETGERVIVRAQARYVRSSARKARLVCDHIRGKSVAEARAILAFSPRAAAEAWSKLLESAVANAENNHDLVGEDLKVHAVFADAGPTIKRYRPRAMGRATRIRKRTSHLTIHLTPKDT